jgi:ABC-2 type transport system permease protein
MFYEIFKFEIRYWLRQPMVYVFTFIIFLMVFGATSSDQLSIGGSIGNVFRNSPYTIQNFYGIMVIIGMLMTTAFVQNAALRDFNYNSHQIVFSSPISKPAYLFGRFLGAICIAFLPFLGVLLGSILGSIVSPPLDWIDASRFGPTPWKAHLDSFLVFVIPNTFFVGAVVFTIATLTRSTMYSFIGTILLLVGYIASSNFLNDISTERLAFYTDALGMRPFELVTKYWTLAEKNSMSIGLGNLDILLNRIIWLGVSFLTLVFGFSRFSFTERASKKSSKKSKKSIISETETPVSMANLFGTASIALPKVIQQNTTFWPQFWSETRTNFWSVVKSTGFIVILLAGIMNMWGSLSSVGKSYGTTLLPVTYNVIDAIRGSMYLFLVSIIVFYSGTLVWRERDEKIDQIYDTMPHHSSISYLSKLASMIGVAFIIQVLGIIVGVFTQTVKGYNNYELGVYISEMLLLDMGILIGLIILSMFFQTIINNKYIAFFAFIAFIAVSGFAFSAMNVKSNLVQYNSVPSYTYSDMNGIAPYISTLLWHRGYWLLFGGLLSVASIVLWLRGTDHAWASRWKNAKHLFAGKTKLAGYSMLAAFLSVGGFIAYNTKVLNTYHSNDEIRKIALSYEQKYKQYENKKMPSITDVKYDIQVYPEERNLIVKGFLTLKNKTQQPMDEIHFTMMGSYNSDIKIKGANLTTNDTVAGYKIFKLSPALAAGAEMKMEFVTKRLSKGIENEVSFTKVVQNGSFFDISDFLPIPGYIADQEMQDKNNRKKYGLPERARAPKLTRDTTGAAMKSYVGGAEWVNVETTISTAADQIAIAPGSLIKEWTKDNRRYFNYKVDHVSLNFSAFMSARYEVAREKWNGIDVEVYYDKKHPKNVPNMINSIKKSLAYYTENFGPYMHKQARIIEFPRYGSFAQAFPGTMPYSEGIGFITDLDPESDIDMVFYIVAHEMGHQWWAHQVIGSDMQGSTLLSESMAQYSALMVMEKEFGRERMTKFLKYETDRYLRQRSGEAEKEVPIFKVENQPYIHYQKGSAVMYNLKEAIGEKNVNKALAEMVQKFAYKPPPYPCSYDLLDAFRRNTPDTLQSLITDLFEDIILFDNRTTKATYTKNAAGKYEVQLEISCAKLRADSLGNETPLVLNNWIDIGVFSKPEGEKEIGKLIGIRREKMTQPTAKFTIVVDEEPYEAGVDPLRYLIDRMPLDNLKKVESN